MRGGAVRRGVEPAADRAADHRFPALTVPEAYRIQQANVERRLAARRTRRRSQDRPHGPGDAGAVRCQRARLRPPDDTMLHDERMPLDLSSSSTLRSKSNRPSYSARRLQGPDVGIADVLAATDYVCVCFEVIDSRIIDWRIRLQDTVADNGSSARVVLGAFKADPTTLELDNLETELELDGIVSRDRQHQRDPRSSGQRHCVARQPDLGIRSHARGRSRRPAGNLHALCPHRRPRPSGGAHRGTG